MGGGQLSCVDSGIRMIEARASPSVASAALMAARRPPRRGSSRATSSRCRPAAAPEPAPEERDGRSAARIQRAVALAAVRRENLQARGVAEAKAAEGERARGGRHWRERLPETVRRQLHPPKDYDDDEAERDARKTAQLGERRRRFSEHAAHLWRNCRALQRSLTRLDQREMLAKRNMKLPLRRIHALEGAYAMTAEDVAEAECRLNDALENGGDSEKLRLKEELEATIKERWLGDKFSKKFSVEMSRRWFDRSSE